MIFLILLLGFFLRLISLNQSLWLDEAISINFLHDYSFSEIFTKYAIADFHPPGYFMIAWVWGRLFGFSEIIQRIPSVLFGVATIWLTYLIGKQFLSKQVALIAALLLALNPLHLYYSQEARMYSLAAMAVSLNFFLFIKLINKKKITVIWIILGDILVLLSDYLAYLIFPAQLLYLLIYPNKEVIKKRITALAVALIIFLPWMSILLSQLRVGSSTLSTVVNWREVVGNFGIKSLELTYVKFIIGRISHPNTLIYTLMFLPAGLLFMIILYQGFLKTVRSFRLLLLLWVIIPLILSQIISFFVPIYSYFRMLFILPAFIILIAVGLESLNGKWRALLVIVTLTIFIVCSTVYLINPAFQREDWRSLVNFLQTRQGTLVLLESNGEFSPFNYYATARLTKKEQINAVGALKNIPARTENDLIELGDKLQVVPDVYLVDYLVEVTDPNRQLFKRLTTLNLKLIETLDFHGVGFVYHFTR